MEQGAKHGSLILSFSAKHSHKTTNQEGKLALHSARVGLFSLLLQSSSFVFSLRTRMLFNVRLQPYEIQSRSTPQEDKKKKDKKKKKKAQLPKPRGEWPESLIADLRDFWEKRLCRLCFHYHYTSNCIGNDVRYGSIRPGIPIPPALPRLLLKDLQGIL